MQHGMVTNCAHVTLADRANPGATPSDSGTTANTKTQGAAKGTAATEVPLQSEEAAQTLSPNPQGCSRGTCVRTSAHICAFCFGTQSCDDCTKCERDLRRTQTQHELKRRLTAAKLNVSRKVGCARRSADSRQIPEEGDEGPDGSQSCRHRETCAFTCIPAILPMATPTVLCQKEKGGAEPPPRRDCLNLFWNSAHETTTFSSDVLAFCYGFRAGQTSSKASGRQHRRACSKRCPYVFPWLSTYDRRQVNKTSIDAARLLLRALATMTQCNTDFVRFALEERCEAYFGEPCSCW